MAPAWAQRGIKTLIVGGSVLAWLSLGGLLVFVFPLLAAGYFWAVRNSRSLEHWGWILLGSLAAAQWSWMVTYSLTDGRSPSVWIVFFAAGGLMVGGLLLSTRQRPWRPPAA